MIDILYTILQPFAVNFLKMQCLLSIKAKFGLLMVCLTSANKQLLFAASVRNSNQAGQAVLALPAAVLMCEVEN